MKQFNKFSGMLVLLCIIMSHALHAQNFNVIDVNKSKDAYPVNIEWTGYDFAYSKFEYAVLKGVAYFSADDGIHGREIWRSDGTVAGTLLLKDINAGSAASNVHDITVSGEKVFFTADNGVNGQEIWVSDGTPQGTKMLKDIYPGIGSSSPSYLVDANGDLYFFVNYSSTADQLWKTDGTTAGTKMVANFYTPAFSYSGYANQLTNVNGRLFFVLNGNGNAELYTSDGTGTGTALVKDINPYWGSYPSYLTALNGMLYFSADDGTGRRLWVSDGSSAGTNTVNNANNIYIEDNIVLKFTVKGNTLFFSGYSADNDGSELCSYNTSSPSNNIEMIKDFNPGNPSHNLYNFTNVNGTIFFTVYAGTGNDQTLWKSDGTTAGTVQVKDINPGGRNIYWYKEFKNANGTLLFSFYDDIHGSELWKSDGTEAGTVMVKEIAAGIYSSINFASTTYIGNNISLFQATDGKSGQELWRTDGTEAGTYLVKNINQAASASSNPYPLAPGADKTKIFFGGFDFKYHTELRVSDGSVTGTKLVKDIIPGSLLGSYPSNIISSNNLTYFFGYILDTMVTNTSDAFTVTRLFKTDGTDAGTSVIQAPGLENIVNYGHGNISGVFTAGNLFYALLFNYQNYQYELWRSDGTNAGTYALKTDIPGYYAPSPVVAGNTLYFISMDYATYNSALWETDGEVAGTHTVPTSPDRTFFNPQNLYGFNGKVYFNANDASYQYYLWSSDGTAAGTKPVKKTVSANVMLGGANGKLLFNAYAEQKGNELWVTDGTAAGTKMVRDIWPGPNGGNPYNGLSTGSLVYFIGTDGPTGGELWKSDGTYAGTKLVKDITPGSGSSDIFQQVNVNGLLYFIYKDALWSSDGTTAGTAPVSDANLVGISNLWNLTSAGGKLFFTAYDPATGQELYAGTSAVAVTSDNTDMLKTAIATGISDVYPNPAKDVLNVKISSGNKGSLNLLVTDVSGKLLINKQLNSATGESLIQLNVSQLPSGTYFLKIISAGGKENGVSKFVKQ